MSTLKRDSGNYLFVYGGWDGHSVLNDMYMITLDSPYNTTLIWRQFRKTRGSWHMTHFAIHNGEEKAIFQSEDLFWKYLKMNMIPEKYHDKILKHWKMLF